MSNLPPSGPAYPGQPQQGWGQEQSIRAPMPNRPWYKKKRWVVPLGIFALLLIIGIVAPPPEAEVAVADAKAAGAETTSTEGAVAAKKKAVAPEPAPERPKLSEEDKFVRLVERARDAADDADNDFRKRLALTKRNDAICKLLKSKRVKNWRGEIERLDTNGDGLGVLEIRIADDVKVATWNNALSDIMDETLIKKSSSVFEAMAELDEGDSVTFSGSFVRDSENCIGEQSLTDDGSTQTPTFTMRFGKIAKS